MESNVSVLIVSWKYPELISQLIIELNQSASIKEICIFYNGKLAGSPLEHKEICSSSINFQFIKSKKNLGFTYPINRLAQIAKSKFLFLLNDDVLISADAFDVMVSHYEIIENQGLPIAALNPIILDLKGIRLSVGQKLNLKTGKNSQLKRKSNSKLSFEEVDFCSGEALLIKRETFWRVGGFDPTLFAYYEETDLCVRLRNEGLKCYVSYKSFVKHDISKSVGVYSPIKFYLIIRNRIILFYHKYNEGYRPKKKYFNKIVFLITFLHDYLGAAMGMVKATGFSNTLISALIDGFIFPDRTKTSTIKSLMEI